MTSLRATDARRRWMALPTWSACLAGFVLASCDGSEAILGSADVGATTPSSAASTATPSSARIGGVLQRLSQIEDAMDSTRFEGVVHTREEIGNEAIELRERVRSDGQRRFQFELLEMRELPSDTDRLSFPITYETAASFHWQFRRFRVRGAERVLTQYSVTEVPGPHLVAGVPCERLRLDRIKTLGTSPGRYEIDVDPASGFVLAWREFDATGHAFRTSTFEQFDAAPDLSAAHLVGQRFPASVLDLDTDLAPQVSFTVRRPDLLPQGFELVRAEVLTVPDSVLGPSGVSVLPTGRWLRFLATDGIELVTFMHSAAPANASLAGGTPPSTPSPGAFRVVSHGGWELGFGDYAGVAFVVTGRVPDGDLHRVVQSSF